MEDVHDVSSRSEHPAKVLTYNANLQRLVIGSGTCVQVRKLDRGASFSNQTSIYLLTLSNARTMDRCCTPRICSLGVCGSGFRSLAGPRESGSDLVPGFGITVRVLAASLNMISYEFRSLWDYGSGDIRPVQVGDHQPLQDFVYVFALRRLRASVSYSLLAIRGRVAVSQDYHFLATTSRTSVSVYSLQTLDAPVNIGTYIIGPSTSNLVLTVESDLITLFVGTRHGTVRLALLADGEVQDAETWGSGRASQIAVRASLHDILLQCLTAMTAGPQRESLRQTLLCCGGG